MIRSTGPQGVKGNKGATGPQGNQGDQGDEGATGFNWQVIQQSRFKEGRCKGF